MLKLGLLKIKKILREINKEGVKAYDRFRFTFLLALFTNKYIGIEGIGTFELLGENEDNSYTIRFNPDIEIKKIVKDKDYLIRFCKNWLLKNME